MQTVQVVVVGAGPAGSTTALLLARAGIDVLIVDRHVFPRDKPCGDCLSPQATRVLDRLGLLREVLAAKPARLRGWRIVAPRGTTLDGSFAAISDGDPKVATALAMQRAHFDAILLDAALRAGARFTRGHVRDVSSVSRELRRVLIDGKRSLDTPLVVGADGLRSMVARRSGARARPPRRQKVSITGHLRGISGVGSYGEMHLAAGLCAGIAPVVNSADPVCNVTLVADARRFGRDIARNELDFYWATLERFDGLRGRFEDAQLLAGRRKPLLGSGGFHQPTRAVTADGLALVGDAAGYFDPFTGQGIHQALVTAEALAAVAARAISEGNTSRRALEPYARAHARTVHASRVLQRLIDAVLARPGIAELAIRRLASRRTAAHAVLAATGDLQPATSLLSPGVILSFAGPRWIERLS